MTVSPVPARRGQPRPPAATNSDSPFPFRDPRPPQERGNGNRAFAQAEDRIEERCGATSAPTGTCKPAKHGYVVCQRKAFGISDRGCTLAMRLGGSAGVQPERPTVRGLRMHPTPDPGRPGVGSLALAGALQAAVQSVKLTCLESIRAQRPWSIDWRAGQPAWRAVPSTSCPDPGHRRGQPGATGKSPDESPAGACPTSGARPGQPG